MGGGGLMDIGCYPISVARFMFGSEPVSVSGYSDTDPEFLTDRLTTGMMNFETGTSVFTCSTQTYRDQFVKIHGTKGMMEIDWPFNTDPEKPSILKISTDEGEVVETFEPRSEEHTSELQSRGHLVCRLLLETKKTIK